MEQVTSDNLHLTKKKLMFEPLGQLSAVPPKARLAKGGNCQLSLLHGQSLIEVVVSSGIAVLLAVALITTSLVTQKSARIAKNNTRATKLAQESLEQVRVFRDRQGFAALPATASSCYILEINGDVGNPGNWKLISSGAPQIVGLEGSNFTRCLSVQNQNANNKLVTVTVSWTESGEDKKVSSQTILSNWESPFLSP